MFYDGTIQKTMDLRFIMEKTIEVKFLNHFVALELWFTIEKLWYYGKTLWHFTENYVSNKL